MALIWCICKSAAQHILHQGDVQFLLQLFTLNFVKTANVRKRTLAATNSLIRLVCICCLL